MIGLDKVTGKLRGDAEADARRTLDAAEEKCRAIEAECDAKIEKLRSEMNAEIDAEGENVIRRARSAAVTEKRNILLSARGEILNGAFDSAREKIISMPRENYINFIVSLVSDAAGLCRVTEGECALFFNRKDKAEIGEDVAKVLNGKLPAITFSVGEREAKICGGVLADFGDTDVDCSVDVLMSQYRTRLEGEVCRILFDKKA